MKPDEVVEGLAELGLETTRRTVLSYEKANLITRPYLYTGKSKEYPEIVVPEFVASWVLTHGEYGLKQQKVAETREKAFKILLKFDEIWKEEFSTGADEVSTLKELIDQKVSWEKSSDFFVATWLSTYYFIMKYAKRNDHKDKINELVKSFRLTAIPAMDITSTYYVSEDFVKHESEIEIETGSRRRTTIIIKLVNIDGSFVNTIGSFAGLLQGNFKEPGYQDYIYMKYIHPEDYTIARPIG